LGTNNIAIGDSAGSALGADFDNIDIGNSGTAGDSGTIRIGDPVVHMGGTFISGIDGATVDMATGVPVVVDAFGRLGTTVSSGRFKEDVRDMGDTSALLKLRPVRFHYKKDLDPKGLEQYGLVAEEVAKVDPNLVVYDRQGQPQTVRYHFVNAM